MRELRVTNRTAVVGEDFRLLTADFRVGNRETKVWFRTAAGPISETFDPFIPIALIPAMRRGWALTIDGPVSARLLEGAQRVQETMTGWYPQFRRVPISVAATAGAPETCQRGVAAFFSGGVDSFYTLQRHRAEITHLIFVHGFDIPLRRTRQRERISGSVRDLAAAEDLQLVEVETNLRQFGQPHVSWSGAYFGAALGAVALLLAPRFARIYLPASVAAEQLEPMGSHPELDPHWSDGTTQLLHDGLEASRFEKVTAIAAWPAAQSHLRVCYQPSGGDLNCGRCRKCLWTMMLLRASGHLDQAATFPKPMDLAALQLYPPVSRHERDRFIQALALLEQRNADPGLREVLRRMLEANRGVPIRGRVTRVIARARNYLAHRLPEPRTTRR